MTTNLPTAEDAPLEITSESKWSRALMERFARQIEALGGDVVRTRNAPFASLYPKADPDAAGLSAGVAVALKGPTSAEPVIVLATLANLAAGAVLLGVLVEATSPGQRGRVAVSGLVSPEVTGLGSGTAGYAKINATTGALSVVASISSGDRVVGRVQIDGTLLVDPSLDTFASPPPIGYGTPNNATFADLLFNNAYGADIDVDTSSLGIATATELTVGGANFTPGTGAPAGSDANGSIYARKDAPTIDDAFYARVGGAWVGLNRRRTCVTATHSGTIAAGVDFVSVSGLVAAATLTITTTPTSGQSIMFECDSSVSDTNTVTIDAGVGKTINGSRTYVIRLAGTCVEIVWNGSEWRVAMLSHAAADAIVTTIGATPGSALARARKRFISVEGLGAAASVQLPGGSDPPVAGDEIVFGFDSSVGPVYTFTLDGNGKAISGASTQVVATPLAWMSIKYTGSTWRIVSSSITAGQYSAIDASHKLVYLCNETSGTTLANLGSTASANATLAGTYAIGNKGLFMHGSSAVLFTAAASTDGAFASGFSQAVNTAFTLEAVINPNAVPGTYGGVAFEVANNARDLFAFISYSGEVAGSSKQRLQVGFQCTPNSINFSYIEVAVPNVGKRMHVAMTRAGTALSMYVDGNLVGTTTLTGAGAAGSTGTFTKAAIGNNNASPANQPFAGRVAEARLSTAARNQAYMVAATNAIDAL